MRVSSALAAFALMAAPALPVGAAAFRGRRATVLERIGELLDATYVWQNNVTGLYGVVEEFANQQPSNENLASALKTATTAKTAANTLRSNVADAYTSAGGTPPAFVSDPTVYDTMTHLIVYNIEFYDHLQSAEVGTVNGLVRDTTGATQTSLDEALGNLLTMAGALPSVTGVFITAGIERNASMLVEEMVAAQSSIAGVRDAANYLQINAPCNTQDIWCDDFTEAAAAVALAHNDMLAAINASGETTVPPYQYTPPNPPDTNPLGVLEYCVTNTAEWGSGPWEYLYADSQQIFGTTAATTVNAHNALLGCNKALYVFSQGLSRYNNNPPTTTTTTVTTTTVTVP